MKEEAQDFDFQNQPEINDAKFNEYTPVVDEKLAMLGLIF